MLSSLLVLSVSISLLDPYFTSPWLQISIATQKTRRRYMAEILPIRRKTLFSQSINQKTLDMSSYSLAGVIYTT